MGSEWELPADDPSDDPSESAPSESLEDSRGQGTGPPGPLELAAMSAQMPIANFRPGAEARVKTFSHRPRAVKSFMHRPVYFLREFVKTIYRGGVIMALRPKVKEDLPVVAAAAVELVLAPKKSDSESILEFPSWEAVRPVSTMSSHHVGWALCCTWTT